MIQEYVSKGLIITTFYKSLVRCQQGPNYYNILQVASKLYRNFFIVSY